jgi:NADH-quinone oxidoreductase subunit L
MTLALCIGLFLPLVGFLVLLAFSSIVTRKLAAYIGCGTIFLSFICFLTILQNYGTLSVSHEVTLFTWIPVKGIDADFSLHLDHLSLLMTLIITGVGFLIHVYSVGYMDHEEDFARYFSLLNFFVFSMLLLVLAAHLLVLFIGWEGVGLASYLLIGYWYQRPSAAKAATKAFVVNRIGDLGLLLGLLLTFHLFGTGNIQDICTRVGNEFAVGAPILAVMTFLYFWGATGKSAQLPLQVWLPDAMEGPTPVSALIHAATMVTAGVYLVVRMHPVFILAPSILQLIGYVGGATALYAALSATSQNDLKRVLAFSTISQLGLMFMACGVGAFFAAMFHLTMHAFVKALLFLSAGNVVHMMHGETDMGKMGGLSKTFTKTHILFLIGVLSMAGIPPLAIFFSKDLIIEQEYLADHMILYYVGLAVTVLTAFYLARAYFLTFAGKSRVESKITKLVTEAPRVMLIPVTILAFLSIVGGVLGFAIGKPSLLLKFLELDSTVYGSKELDSGFHMSIAMWLSIGAAVIGIGVASYLYTRFVDRLGKPIQFLKKSFYFDQMYDLLLVRPIFAISNAIARLFEPKIFDGSLEISWQTTNEAAGILQRIQSGQIRSYISWIVIGAVFLIVYLIFEGSHA